ncbi:LysR family transcriptional regulator [Humitalea sp. 24SJ18S-53]|uniref:LysR family transcriptional regulator n=1 Tax=Humitalea sp. 24SJ18S-53 TaxID=3422307 RepID=UPI003D677081
MRATANLNRLAYFAAVVETGSFTAAARRLGVTKAVVSQQVARLEEATGTSLLIRTTRRVHPTEAGRVFHARCAVILGESEAAFEEMAQAQAEPSGTLRVTATMDYGTAAVVPALVAFGRRYPDCATELTLSDRTLDLAGGEIDMAIRVGWLADSSHQARRIATFRQLLVAAPGFAAAEPAALEALPFVANTALRAPLQLGFTRDGQAAPPVRPQSTMAIDATLAVHAAVLAGAGLSVLPEFVVAGDLAAGRLVHVLPDWRLPDVGVHAVFPAARFRPAKVSAFVETLIAAERGRRSG